MVGLAFDLFQKEIHNLKVDLNWDGIAKFTESGIQTNAGEAIDFDIIIFGTGFDVVSHYSPNNSI
jgi:cation diffusion facilitator CzcD-associated flavoprotein CzcO